MTLPTTPPFPTTQPEPQVIRVLNNYRIAIDGRDEIMTANLADHWLRVERQLEAEINWMAQELAQRMGDGDPVTDQIIMRMDRYKRLQRQVEAEIAKYNTEAAAIIAQTQETMIALGIDAAQAAIIAQTDPFFAFNRINVPAVQNMVGLAGDGSPLLSLLQNSYGDASAGILNAMIDGVAHGLGASQIAQNMTEGMAMGLERALLIARTETMRAYRQASLQQYRDSGVVSGFQRLVKKSTACLACLMLDGQEFKLEDDFSDHPRGKCQCLAIIPGVTNKWEKGEDWFNNLPPEKQMEMMGKDRYEAWKRGDFELKDLSKMAHSDVWGDSPRVATLDELGISNTFFKKIDKSLSSVFSEFPEIKNMVDKNIDFTHILSGAEYDFDSKKIRLPSYLKDKSNAELLKVFPDIEQTIRHEMAHAIMYSITTKMNEDEFSEYKNNINNLISKLGYPTEYSKKNYREWIAERFSLESLGKLPKILIPILKRFTK